MDARHQLPWVKGFGEIIVGSNLQPNNPIDLVVPGCYDQNRNMRLSANATQDVKTVKSRKDHIEKNKDMFPRERPTYRFLSVVQKLHFKAFDFEVLHYQATCFNVIIHQ